MCFCDAYKFKFLTALSVILISGLTGVQHLKADLVLSFTQDGSNTNFFVNPGEVSAPIPIYLVQSGGENRLSTIGLFAAGASATIGSGNGLSTYQTGTMLLPAHWQDTVASKTNFDTNTSTVQLQGITTDSSPVTPPIGSNAVQVGSFQVFGGTAGSSTSLTLSLQGLVQDPILLSDFTAIRPTAPNLADRVTFASANIIAVPEPSTLLLVPAGLVILFQRRRKR